MVRLPNRVERANAGQMLPATIIILGIMLLIGFIFLGLINRNIFQSGVSRQRSRANDLAEAGIRYAHAQLLYSPLGADWRPFATAPFTLRDPDFDFLKPDPDADPTNGDQGGPDGLGAYTRVNYGDGRFVVRVRYAPSDAFLFSSSPNGPLRQPGRARNYLIIESVGRVGKVNPNDPTTTLQTDRRQSRKLIAFASIGIIEHAMFITNKDRVSTAAEYGSLRPLGVSYGDVAGPGTPVDVPIVLGDSLPMFNFGNPPVPSPGNVIQGGNLYSNADIVLHGRVVANLNSTLGDGWLVNGTIRGADNNALLTLNRAYWDQAGGVWQQPPAGPLTTRTISNGSNPSLDSRVSSFNTFFGMLRDGLDGTDLDAYWRAVGVKPAPSILVENPDTGLNRYIIATRESGVLRLTGNDGRLGHGSGMYVNNTQDRQMRFDEDGREAAGSAESLLYDWFNPNNGQANSGWMGPYYIPRGAWLLLQYDGFTIIRDGRATGNERTWRTPDNVDTGNQGIRYRFGRLIPNGPVYVINSYTPGANIGAASPNFAAGRPFNGVVFFEGNVRIRGVITTDLQMTVVSNASIYVEGSVTKGVVRNHITDPTGPPSPAERTTGPSSSTLMLMAKDYVALNTTMFFGPGPGQALEEVNEANSPVAWNPLRMRTGGATYTFRADMNWNPNSPAPSVPSNPSTWTSYNEQYAEFAAPGNRLNTKLVMTHATDDGPAPYTFFSLDVNFGLPNSNYYFAMLPPNSASPFYGVPFGVIYGLGGETWQRYPKFESTAFDLIDPAVAVSQSNGFVLRANMAATAGDYQFLIGDENDFGFRHNNVGFGATNDYLIARSSLIPHDILIQAAMFAEEGSFVVIPGNWYNPNPNDTRQLFLQRVSDYRAPPYSLTQADAVRAAWRERQENFGAGPDMPFFGEPIDCKLSIVGAVSQNMPVPMSYQAEWLRKWGWIPRHLAALYRFAGSNATEVLIPQSHVPVGYDISAGGPDRYVPNLSITYDPVLATASATGFGTNYIRRDRFGRALAPMPSLPVSPVLSYFGEVLQ